MLQAAGLSREQVLQRLVGGGVDATLATEILDSIARNRPRPRPLRIAFGLVALAAGGVALLFMKIVEAGVLIVFGLLTVVDGFRGKR